MDFEELVKNMNRGKKWEDITKIDFSNQKLAAAEIDVLNKCVNLEHLDLSRNRLKSLLGIFLPNLKFLNIEDNCISDVTFLSDLPSVEKLYLDGNPLNIADRYIAVDQLKNLTVLDAKSCAELQGKLRKYHKHIDSEATRIYSSKCKLNLKNCNTFEIVQQRRLFLREMLNRMSSSSSMPPKFQRYKVQDYVEKLFKSLDSSHAARTPQKNQNCIAQSSPSVTLKGLASLQLSSPAKRTLASPFSSPTRAVNKEKQVRFNSSFSLKYLDSSQFSPTQVRSKLKNLALSEQRKTRNSPVKDSRSESLKERKRKLDFDESCEKPISDEPRDVSYQPQVFLRCHVPTNDPQDCSTQVWSPAFEIDASDPIKTTDLVATCGGNIVCFINCQTGHVVKRYKCDSNTENLFAVSWTVLEIGEQKQATSILATAGFEKKIYLVHPSQLKCYLVFKAHTQAINCLQFHPEERTWLFSGGRDSFVHLWDIGEISLPSYSAVQKKLITFEARAEVIQIALSQKYNCLFGSTDKNIAVWDLNSKSYVAIRKPSVTLTLPENCKSDDDGVIDGLTLVSDRCMALKVSCSGKVVLWDMTTIFHGHKLKKMKQQEITPLAIYLWSDGDSDYSYIGSCRKESLVACGDNAGRLWLYDTRVHTESENTKFSNELSLPCVLLPWPKLIFDNETLSVKPKVIINSVQFNWNGDYLVACSDTNLVCIWRRK